MTVPTGPGHNLRSLAFASDGHTAIASSEDDTILRSTDGGQTWSPVNIEAKHPILALSISADGRNAIAVGAHGPILYSGDSGTTWLRASSDISGQLNGIAVSADGRAAVAVGDDGKLASAILRSTDAGATWTSVSSGAGDGLLWKVAIAADGHTALAVDGRGSILRSTDTGANWSTVYVGNQVPLDAIALAADGHTAIAVGIGDTILRSTDAGQTWHRVQQGRSPSPIAWLLVVVGFVTALPAFQRLPERKPELFVQGLAGLFTPDRPLDDKDKDVAGTDALAAQISRFLRNLQTEPPLTVAITGPWGTGKSSVLNRLRQDLRNRAIRPVWFNAWHHQKEENIFAALLQQVRKQAVPPAFSVEGLRVRTRLFRRRVAEKPLSWASGLVVFSFIIALFLPRSGEELGAFFENAAKINLSRLTEAIIKIRLTELFPIGSTLWVIYSAAWGFRDRLKSRGLDPGKLMTSATHATRWTDLGGQLAFHAKFADALKEVTEALGDRRLTIIIDDLDRCRPDQIAEIMEAINFLTNAGHCFVILGIDRRQVLNGIGLAYAAMAKEDAPVETDERTARSRFAENFLRKLIQMEVPVPDFDSGAAARLVAEAGRENGPKTNLTTDHAWRSAAIGGVVVALAFGGYFGGDMVHRTLNPARTGQLIASPTLAVSDQSVSASGQTGTQPMQSTVGTVGQGPNFESREPAPAVTARLLLGIALPLGLLAILALWLQLRRRPFPAVELNSPEFVKALNIWAPAAVEASPSPRELKRFLNQLRFIASVEDPDQRCRNQRSSVWAFIQPDPELVVRLANQGTDPVVEVRARAQDPAHEKRKAYQVALDVATRKGALTPTRRSQAFQESVGWRNLTCPCAPLFSARV